MATRICLVWLLILLLVAGCAETGNSAGAPARADTSADARARRAREQVAQVMAALQPAGLVFPLDRDVNVDGRTVRLKRLAIDREMVFLAFEPDRRSGVSITLVGLRNVGGSFDSDYAAFALAEPLDPDRSAITIRVAKAGPGSTPYQDVAVLVDLSPLRTLPAPERLNLGTTANGLRLEALELRRGLAVSVLDVSGTIIDPAALVATDERTDRSGAQGQNYSLGAESSTGPVATLDLGSLRVGPDGWQATLSLLDLPRHGELRLIVDWLYFKGLSADATGKSRASTVNGPRELTIPLDRS